MQDLQKLVDKYIKANELAWSPSTARSERSRLRAALRLLDGSPETLWEGLQSKGAYTRRTTFTRVIDFWSWLIEIGYTQENPYAQWRRRHARLFKHVYRRKYPKISFEDARKRIDSISDTAVKRKAHTILNSGLRVSEYDNRAGSGVVGKGGKFRVTFSRDIGREKVSYHRFWRALKAVGLRPHDLRKIAATRLAEVGANEADICKIMGWSSFQTAKNYIDPSESRIQTIIEEAFK